VAFFSSFLTSAGFDSSAAAAGAASTSGVSVVSAAAAVVPSTLVAGSASVCALPSSAWVTVGCLVTWY